MSYENYSPAKYFENSKDGVIPEQYVVNFTAAGTNKTLIAAVTGKRIRILSAVISAANVAGYILLQSGTTAGKSILYFYHLGTMPVVLPYNASGWGETLTGEAVIFSAQTAEQVITATYIVYTP